MAATVIDGKAFAADVRGQVEEHVTRLKTDHGITPGLAVVLVGADPASEVYVAAKYKQTVEVGMNSFEHRLPGDVSEEVLFGLIDKLNADDSVHGILCQFPVPDHLDERAVVARIDPSKDVDGLSVVNAGLLASGETGLVSCTPLGCLMLLRDQIGNMAGKNAVVIGRSNLFGKPMAQLLLQENCTVTIAHSRTDNLAEVCARADILVAAVGAQRWCRLIGLNQVQLSLTLVSHAHRIPINRVKANYWVTSITRKFRLLLGRLHLFQVALAL